MSKSVLKSWNAAILVCYEMTGTDPDSGAAIARTNYRFEDQYKIIRDSMITRLNKQIMTHKLGDSIIVTVHSDTRQEPQIVLQTSDLRENFACWYSIMKTAGDKTEACTKRTNLVYFKVTQMATQTINRNPRQPWRINKAILKNETISYSRTLNHKSVAIISKPGFTDVSMFLFDEIYTVSFSLDPIVEHVKDVWMI